MIIQSYYIIAIMRRSPNVGTMLGQCRRLWANILQKLGLRLVYWSNNYK